MGTASTHHLLRDALAGSFQRGAEPGGVLVQAVQHCGRVADHEAVVVWPVMRRRRRRKEVSPLSSAFNTLDWPLGFGPPDCVAPLWRLRFSAYGVHAWCQPDGHRRY
jgi:hypothetical protein